MNKLENFNQFSISLCVVQFERNFQFINLYNTENIKINKYKINISGHNEKDLNIEVLYNS